MKLVLPNERRQSRGQSCCLVFSQIAPGPVSVIHPQRVWRNQQPMWPSPRSSGWQLNRWPSKSRPHGRSVSSVWSGASLCSCDSGGGKAAASWVKLTKRCDSHRFTALSDQQSSDAPNRGRTSVPTLCQHIQHAEAVQTPHSDGIHCTQTEFANWARFH